MELGIWVFPRIMVPQNGWFIMENPIKNESKYFDWLSAGGESPASDVHVAIFKKSPQTAQLWAEKNIKVQVSQHPTM